MLFAGDNQRAINDVKELLERHPTKWQDVAGKRSVQYVPFSEEELKDPKVDGMEAGLVEQAEGTADALMLRTFAKEVIKRLPEAERFEVNASNVKSKWMYKLSEDQQKDVLNEVVRKTPVVFLSGKAPRHCGQELNAAEIKLGPTDSLNITGHGSPKHDVICVSPDVETGKVLTAEDTVKRLQADLKESPFKASLKGENNEQAPKLKLNCCGSGGKFVGAFAKAAETEGLEADVYAYGMDVIQNWTPDSALSNLELGSRFVSTYEEAQVVETLKAAGKAATAVAKQPGMEEQTLEQMTAGDALDNEVELLLAEEKALSDLEGEVEKLEEELMYAEQSASYLDVETWGEDFIEGVKKDAAAKKSALEAKKTALTAKQAEVEMAGVGEKLDRLIPLQQLDQMLNEKADELNLPAESLRQMPLKTLEAELGKHAERLNLAAKHKASAHRTVTTVRDALRSSGGLSEGKKVAQGNAAGHMGMGSK